MFPSTPQRLATSGGKQQTVRSRPLVGSFEENVLNNRLNPIRTVDGYTAEVRASCRNFQPSPLRSGVQVSFFSAGDCFPYLGQVPIGHRGYKIPKKGTLQVAFFNPNGTIVKLFVLIYDLTDMPPNSHTFLRQKTLYFPTTTTSSGDNNDANSNDSVSPPTTNENKKDSIGCQQSSVDDIQPGTIPLPGDLTDPDQIRRRLPTMLKARVRYLIQLNIVSSKSGRIYLNRDLRIFISKKDDLETASQIKKQEFELKAINEMPSEPRYFSR